MEQGRLVGFGMAFVNVVLTSCSYYRDISVLCQEMAAVQAGSKVLAERHKSS